MIKYPILILALLVITLITISSWLYLSSQDNPLLYVIHQQRSNLRIYLLKLEMGKQYKLSEYSELKFKYKNKVNDSLITLSFDEPVLPWGIEHKHENFVHISTVGLDESIFRVHLRKESSALLTMKLTFDSVYNQIMDENDTDIVDITEYEDPRSWVVEKTENHPDGSIKSKWDEKYSDDFFFVKDGKYLSWNEYGQLVLECYYKQSRKDSSYTVWSENGAIKLTGNYKEGIKHGRWEKYDTLGGLFYAGDFVNGLGTLFYTDGNIRAIENPHNDKMTVWYPNGVLKAVINQGGFGTNHYKDDGTPFFSPYLAYRSFDNYFRFRKVDTLDEFKLYDGHIQRRPTFDADSNLVIMTEWYRGGQMLCELNYKNGLLDGSVRTWAPNGNLIKDFYYKQGKRNGEWSYYHYDATLEKKEKYKMGEKITDVTLNK